jgi:hypothetical protein
MKVLTLIISLLFCGAIYSQTPKERYESTFESLSGMLEGKQLIEFKRAVFLVEDSFLEGQLDYVAYDKSIKFYKSLCEQLILSRDLNYTGKDKQQVSKYAAVFTVMKDTLPILKANGETVYHLPFAYDFDDITGESDWTKMFVTKLLSTHSGNCHSLPYLYKIIAEELGEEAHLAFAPNHIYIKQRCKSIGWYNTELTSGMFPIDSWLMASGYVHLKSIQSGIYMDALDDKQSIAVCLIDLAQGYRKKFGIEDVSFIIKSCDKALEFYPNYINALLLQAEIKLKLWEKVSHDSLETSAEGLAEIQALYNRIHELGYRKMPDGMYLDWLVSLKNEKSKYQNTKINF